MVDLNDNPMARARLSALMAAVTIERTVGMETIPHVTPRDASIMGLQSQLLGAHAEGVRNILAVTGDPPHVGDYPGSNGVYEIDSIGLVGLLAHLNRGEDYSGKAIDAPTSFYVGCRSEPVRGRPRRGARALPAQARRGRALRDDAGALRPRLPRPVPRPARRRVADPDPRRDLAACGAYELAFRLHNEVPGITIPDAVQQRLADAGADAAAVGLELGRELLEGSRERAAGIYVIPPFKEPAAALDLLT